MVDPRAVADRLMGSDRTCRFCAHWRKYKYHLTYACSKMFGIQTKANDTCEQFKFARKGKA